MAMHQPGYRGRVLIGLMVARINRFMIGWICLCAPRPGTLWDAAVVPLKSGVVVHCVCVCVCVCVWVISNPLWEKSHQSGRSRHWIAGNVKAITREYSFRNVEIKQERTVTQRIKRTLDFIYKSKTQAYF
jgi:hypothetical protein